MFSNWYNALRSEVRPKRDAWTLDPAVKTKSTRGTSNCGDSHWWSDVSGTAAELMLHWPSRLRTQVAVSWNQTTPLELLVQPIPTKSSNLSHAATGGPVSKFPSIARHGYTITMPEMLVFANDSPSIDRNQWPARRVQNAREESSFVAKLSSSVKGGCCRLGQAARGFVDRVPAILSGVAHHASPSRLHA